jgi:Flp pilus assembly protein TadD
MRPKLFPVLAFLLASFIGVQAQDLRLPLPKKSKYTPVQQLNREGVDALKKQNTDRAKRLFYKAYLIDPNDPFTLNNLGYVSELEGDMDRAQRYYDQAQANTSDAVVDKSTDDGAKGKAVAKIAGHTEEGPLKVNQMNSEAITLLSKDRAPEADLLLQKALKLDPKNPFTLNNMGFAREKEGELEDAVNFYTQSANTGARDPIIVTLNKDWRGRPISEVAAGNADKTRKELRESETAKDKVARLNLRGVSAMNRNDRKAARDYFAQAYKLDPKNAFALNNMGYLAEMEGDRETAQSYYDHAHEAQRASDKVAVSTRPEVEGLALGHVAQQSSDLVDARMQAEAETRRQSGQKPALRTRDNRIIVDRPALKKTPDGQETIPPNDDQRPQLLQRQNPNQQQQANPPEDQNAQPQNQTAQPNQAAPADQQPASNPPATTQQPAPNQAPATTQPPTDNGQRPPQ